MSFFPAIIALTLSFRALFLEFPVGVSFNCGESRPFYLIGMTGFLLILLEPLFRALTFLFLRPAPKIVI
jgi:hypothetical protein